MTIVLGGARSTIDVAPPPVARGGFLAAANVVDLSDGDHALMGAEYLTNACTFGAAQWTGEWCRDDFPSQCEEPTTPIAAPKGFLAGYTTHVTGDPFVLYAGDQCDLATLAERLESATASFNYGERRGVDAAMAAWLNTIDTEVDATASTPNCLIGEMEAWLAGNYGGEGILAMAIPTVTQALGLGYLRNDGGTVRTPLGTPVAAYVPSALSPSYDAWALGQLTLLRGPLHTYTVPPMIREDGSCAPARALAERIYVPLVECAVGKFESTCCDCAATP